MSSFSLRRVSPDWLAALCRVLAVLVPMALGVSIVMGATGRSTVMGTTGGSAAEPEARVGDHSRALSLRSGESVPELLARGGISGRDARRLLDLIRPYADWTIPDPALEARFHRRAGEPPERIELRIDRDRTLDFRLHGAMWAVSVDSVAVSVDTAVVTGLIETSVWAARLGGDADRLSVAEKGDLAGQLAGVYAWQIDFYRDPRPGDAFRLAIERAVRPDGSVREATVLAAEYTRRGELFQAYRFRSSEDGAPSFYDENGTALRGAFLRAPLDLVRVTSRFGPARYHPLLGTTRRHRGIDYGAASGTPVHATGDGSIARAGWAGDFGLMIEIDHGRGIRTRYAHLSGIADGLGPGRGVRQGEVIGTVGSTGLSTAPHLHYEFLLAGRQVDPASVDLPVAHMLPDADTLRFGEARGAARALLGHALWPGGLPVW